MGLECILIYICLKLYEYLIFTETKFGTYSTVVFEKIRRKNEMPLDRVLVCLVLLFRLNALAEVATGSVL